MLISVAATIIMFGVVFGDASMAAIVLLMGNALNTLFNAYIARQQRQIKATITAPRTIVYDANGQPVGTMLPLKGDPGNPLFVGRRRHTDDTDSAPDANS